MSSKKVDGFEAFLTEGVGSFGCLDLYEHPLSQDAWQKTLDNTENQKLVQNLFFEEIKKAENMRMLLDARLKNDGKGEEHTDQTMSNTAIPKNKKSKSPCARCPLMCLNHCKEKEDRSHSTEVTSFDYLTTSHDSSAFSPVTFWCMLSALRVHLL